jgi:hypothetical protein
VEYLIDSGRVFLGLVFLCSVVGKVRGAAAFRAFRDAVGELAPPLRRASGPVTVVVTAAEATVVVTLAVPATVVTGFALAAALLVAFTAGLLGVLRLGKRTSCHCFGSHSDPVAPRHVVRNALLITVALAGLSARLAVSDVGTAADARLMLAAGVAALLALITVALDDLVGLFAPAGRQGAPMTAKVPR